MDAFVPPYPPGSAVAGLMQQLKNGEITKMQLFQQIARLQAGSTAAIQEAQAPQSAAVKPVLFAQMESSSQVTNSTASLVIGRDTSGTAVTAAPFVSFNYSPPRAPTQVAYSQSKPSGASAVDIIAEPMSSTSRIGALNDADILSSGVSHDKAPRLSVQEWMANKSRTSAAGASWISSLKPTVAPHVPSLLAPTPAAVAQSSPSAGTAHFATTTYGEPSLFSLLGQSSQTQQKTVPGQSEAGARSVDFEDSGQHDLRHEDLGQLDRFYDDSHNHVTGSKLTGSKNKGGGSGSGDETRFHTRVTRWKSQKDALREQMKQQLLQSELDECTFAPKVNPKSTKVVAKLRGRQRSVRGGDGDRCGINSGSGSIAVSERLYQEADNYKAREELAAKLKAEEEAELERECTFRPKINRNNPLTEKVKPKYMDIPKREAPTITPAAIEAAAKELEQCTFVPQVNPISQEMISAQLYLQQNIYERLSRPCVTASDSTTADSHSGDDGGSDYVHEIDAMGSPPLRTQDDCYVRHRRRRGSAAWGPQSSTQRPRSAGGIVTEEEKAERAKQFEDFLERQKFHEQARKKRIETTQQQLVPPHRPSINKKSQMMMENGRKGDFLERISQYAIRKEQDTVKNKTVRVSDPNCTFKPTINPTSAKRSARSVTELSRGDLLRRETTQRLMKLRMEQEEMASLTFRPELSRASQRVEGRLKILTSPDTYLQRIQQQSQAHMIKQRRAIQEKEMEEFSECTFKPRTIEAPAYVQRIARSVVLTKALKKQQDTAERASQKPEWK